MEKEDPQFIEVNIFGKDNQEIRLELPELSRTNVTCKEILMKVGECLGVSTQPPNLSIDQIFSLSLNSKYLELPLKEGYKPFGILLCWSDLLKTFSPKSHHLNPDKIEEDQPVLSLQRNMFLAKSEEEKINNELVLKLLYEEAKANVLAGKYQTDDEDYLAAVQLKIDHLRTGDDRTLTSQHLKEHLDQYLSANYLQSTTGSFLTLNRLRATSLDQRIVNTARSDELNRSLKDLYKRYLRRCHQLAQYGAVFYQGQIEKNQSMITSLIKNQDVKVWAAINYEGIHFIDKKTSVSVLSIEQSSERPFRRRTLRKLTLFSFHFLGQKLIISFTYDIFLWELAVPQSINENQNALPCLFIEINDDEVEKKIMQIFSKQAKLMDNTLRQFDEKIRSSQDLVDSSSFNGSISSSKSGKSLKKSLNFCSCATFNKKGDCVKKQGSFKFVKKLVN